MIDIDRLLELVPHYILMVVLMVLVVGIIRTIVGELRFWIELLALLIIAFSYPRMVQRFGVAPSAWQDR